MVVPRGGCRGPPAADGADEAVEAASTRRYRDGPAGQRASDGRKQLSVYEKKRFRTANRLVARARDRGAAAGAAALVRWARRWLSQGSRVKNRSKSRM